MRNIDEDALHRAINKWEEEAPIEMLIDVLEYQRHFLEEYGIDVSVLGGLGDPVVDEQKYMLFILRWS